MSTVAREIMQLQAFLIMGDDPSVNQISKP
jgi:hypothetical protein